MKKFIFLIALIVITFVAKAQYDTVLTPGTHFTFPVLPDASTYTIGVKNGIPINNEIWLKLTDYVPTTVGWTFPGGSNDFSDSTHTHLPGHHNVAFQKNSGTWTYVDIYIRYFVDIINSTSGSATYGQMPDTVWIPQGGTAILSVGTNFANVWWFILGSSSEFSTNNTINVSCGTYVVDAYDNSIDTYDTIVVAEICTPVSSTQNINICAGNSYTIGTHTYSTAGTYIDTIPAVNTCDSIVTTHLSVNQPTASTQNISACESYTWFGTTYTASGTHTHVIPNAHGCDSTITLNLAVVNQFTMNIIPDTVIVIQGHTDTVYVTVDDEVTLLWSTGSDSLSAIVSATGWCYVTATHSVCGSQIDSVYVDVITGISEPADNNRFDVKVCPNPATDFIQILGYTDGIEKVEIYNQIGQLVLRVVDKTSLININVSMLSKGIYYLKIDTGFQRPAKPMKFVKQ